MDAILPSKSTDRKLIEIKKDLDALMITMLEFENIYKDYLDKVHPAYSASAVNLVHYLAIFNIDMDLVYANLNSFGLGPMLDWRSDVMAQLKKMQYIIGRLLDSDFHTDETLELDVEKVLSKHREDLFGKSPDGRKSSILVTQPTLAAEDPDFSRILVKAGMDCARVNCAHDTPEIWKSIIDHIHEARPDCRIFMDLGGPKLRTGKMKPGHKVIHIKPQRNSLGQVTVPANIWLAPYGILPPDSKEADAIIPVNKKWLRKTRKGSYFTFTDARGKKCKISIQKKDGIGRWAVCKDSAFVTTGTQLTVFNEHKSTGEVHTVHEMLPLEEVIYLYEGDLLRLDKKDIPGEPAQYDAEGALLAIPHISCTLPEVFEVLKTGDPVYFDDGKIEGCIETVESDHASVRITGAKKNGSKLKADKGINLPQTNLPIKGLTTKDKEDLKFVVDHADSVNFSFVNSEDDVLDLLNEFEQLGKSVGIVLKIETKEAFSNLPSILLTAMRNYPVGVMIARGDLAIETGWKNFGPIQQAIIHACESAHIPVIWATQVLENLAKKGIPTRAEITDVTMAQQADCIMLNKGVYIDKAVKLLDKILNKLQQEHAAKGAVPSFNFKT